MNVIFTKEEMEALPESFRIQDAGEGILLIEQSIFTKEAIENQRVMEPSRLRPARKHALQYVLDQKNGGYEVVRANLKGIFAGYTQEKHDTKRGVFELLRHVRPEHEALLLYHDLLEKWETQNFPTEWNGFTLDYLITPFDLVYYIVEEGSLTSLVRYTSPVKAVTVQLRKNENIYINHERQGSGIEQCRELLEKEIKKHRLKTVYAAK